MAQKKLPKKITNRIQEYLHRLQRQGLPITKVIVFGSTVKGRRRRFSDIDLCVVSPRFQSRHYAFQYLWRALSDEDILAGIEPIGYAPKYFESNVSPLVWEIKKTGIPVKLT